MEAVEGKFVRSNNSDDAPDDHVLVRRLEIVFSGGLVVRHNNLDYSGLRSLIAKLKLLC